MEQVKKGRGRPRKDPLIAAIEDSKKRGRPSGTRTKHRVTVQSVKKNWEKMYNELLKANQAAADEIIKLSVELNHREKDLDSMRQRTNAAELHIKNLDKTIRAKEIRETKLFGIIEYLEDKVKNAITNNSI